MFEPEFLRKSYSEIQNQNLARSNLEHFRLLGSFKELRITPQGPISNMGIQVEFQVFSIYSYVKEYKRKKNVKEKNGHEMIYFKGI